MNSTHKVIIKPFNQLTIEEYHSITQAREQVFYLEQQVTCPDADPIDPQSIFVWMETKGRVVAFLRIIPQGVAYQEVSIGRVLVVAEHRGNGLCRSLMLQAMNHIDSTWGAQPIRLSAQLYLKEFYLSLGFEAVSEPYLEAGILHIKMLRSVVN